MSSIYGLQRQASTIETQAHYVLRDLPEDTPQEVRSMVEVIEVEARSLQKNAESLRRGLRAQIDE